MSADDFNAFVTDGVTEVGNLVWSTVPEPMTLTMLALGAVVVARSRCRRAP